MTRLLIAYGRQSATQAGTDEGRPIALIGLPSSYGTQTRQRFVGLRRHPAPGNGNASAAAAQSYNWPPPGPRPGAGCCSDPDSPSYADGSTGEQNDCTHSVRSLLRPK